MNQRKQSRYSTHGFLEQGFTLIEVLFAVVFLAAGLLGIAALEDIALARNIDARRLTAATNAATEMLERIRFNAPLNSVSYPGAAIPAVPYLYHGVVACASPVRGVPSAPATPCAAPVPVVNIAPCVAVPYIASAGNTNASAPANTTASGDYIQWGAQLSQLDANGVPLLPNAVGTVCATQILPAGPGPTLGQIQIAVTVSWTSGLRNPSIFMSTIVAPL